MSFNELIKKFNLKKKATSNINFYQVLDFIGSNNVGIYLRDGPFANYNGIGNLHPSKGTHWVCYINENYIVSCGYSPPKKRYKFIMKRNGYCFILNISFRKVIVFVRVIVYIFFT